MTLRGGALGRDLGMDFSLFQMGKLRPIYPFVLSPNSLLRADYVAGSVLGAGIQLVCWERGEDDNAWG